ncbi:MAG: hypothetical protein K6F78_08910 [Bacteroidaceae bacterium]|nr:hypothetical protein [Bacteroidaceae bacterium]
MWIVIAVIVVFIFSRALSKAGNRGGGAWREEDDWAQLDEDLEDYDF